MQHLGQSGKAEGLQREKSVINFIINEEAML